MRVSIATQGCRCEILFVVRCEITRQKRIASKYARSPKGKAVMQKYQRSSKGKAAEKRYQQSPKGIAARNRSYERSKQRENALGADTDRTIAIEQDLGSES